MPELQIFNSMQAALDAGFHQYDRTRDGYLVRKMVDGQWQMAIVKLVNYPQLQELPDSSQIHYSVERATPPREAEDYR